MMIPKPLLPLGDVPILEVVLRQLGAAGFERAVLTLGHMAPIFQAHLGQASKFGMRLEFIIEEEPLGTAGPVRLARGLEDDFLVMNGDLLTTLDYKALFAHHCNCGAWGTITLQRREVKIDYGVIHASKDGILQDYEEKPTIPYEVSMGINVLSRGCLDFIPKSGKFDMPELMLAMHRAGKLVACYRPACYWKDIGRFDDYQEASADFVADPARFLHPKRGRWAGDPNQARQDAPSLELQATHL
jgi:NDP-sugar pyrophosphorylase family protein